MNERMDAKSLLLTAGFGWLAGMRTLTAPVAASLWLRKQGWLLGRGRVARAVTSPLARVALPPLAATEMFVLDKWSRTPDRTAPASLAMRVACGAFVGAAIAETRRGSGATMGTGALLGAGFALLSSYANLWLRRSATARTGTTEQRAGLAEDALALGLATALVRA
jgi:uncharacterized membrane protein